VAIAGLLAMQPEILLLDELGKAHTTLVFTTHDIELAYRFADDVAIFNSGRTLAQGPAADILSNDELLRAAALGAPLLLQIGLRARDLGILAANDPLPRTPDAVLSLLQKPHR